VALSWSNDLTAGYSTAAEWRKLFGLKPHQSREIVFGFLLRFVVGLVAVVVPTIFMLVIGLLDGWYLNNTLLVLYGIVICAMVLLGEHVRSRVYERMLLAPELPEELYDQWPNREIKDRVIAGLGELPRRSSTNRFAWRVVKQIFDIVVGTITLWLVGPLIAIIAAAIKFDSRGPIIIGQRRVGLDGRKFTIYKFRTLMVLESQDQQPEVTSVGRFLRRTNLDELPQLFNVLMGQMSLVGPQSYPLDFAPLFALNSSGFSFFHNVKPGLTGWAQIHRLQTRNDPIKMFRYDVWYVNNWTFLLDIRIILRTLKTKERHRLG
jgi:lipopolysaccharide/colanic/teichoic acid biosynthesis glycosyltransferase